MTLIPTSNPDLADALRRFGLLLLSDPRLPSVAGLIAGEPVRGSWWSHPRSRAIYAASEELSDNPDVLLTKLVSGKVTFVHRRLWNEVLSVALSRDPWQLQGLSRRSLLLLDLAEEMGEVRCDRLPDPSRFRPVGENVRVLENRLLFYTESVHTERGAHAKVIASWKHWSRRRSFTVTRMSSMKAQKRLEEILQEWNKTFAAEAHLPWTRSLETRKSRNRGTP